MGDGARISHEPGSLIGRDDDLEYLTAFADRAAVSGGALVASVAAAHHLQLSGDGDIDTAHRLLTGAIEMQPEPYDAASGTMVEALYTLGWVCYFGGRPELWAPFRQALGRLRPEVPELLTLVSATFADPARTVRPVLGRIDAAVAELTEHTYPVWVAGSAWPACSSTG